MPINAKVGATFSEAMDPLTISTATFTFKQGATPVLGTVTYSGMNAVFSPAGNLLPNTLYTATISTGAKDLVGNALANDYSWNWTTGAAPDTTPPKVTAGNPLNLAIGVALNSVVRATFDKAMDSKTITNQTFTVNAGTIPVTGTVTYDAITRIASFKPSGPLAYNTDYTVTVSNGAKDLTGNALVVPAVGGTANPWAFKTQLNSILPLNPTAPPLGEAGRFVILASQAVTTTSGSAISNGDIGIIDLARSNYEGFVLGANPGQFTVLTNGLSYAHDDMPPYVVPAPYASTIAFIDQVRTDLGNANSYLAADPSPGGSPTQVCPIQLGGQVLARGVYKTASNVQITTGPLHLDAQGDPNSVFIFSIEGTLTTGAPGGNIILDNGALAKNVFFRTGGVTVIGAGTLFKGNVFAWTQVNVNAGADITGRLFALTERVTLISDIVTKAP